MRYESLVSGIALSLSADKSALDRVQLSSGTEPGLRTGPMSYEEGAVIPRNPWRSLTGEETESLIARDFGTSAEAVRLVKLDFDFEKHFSSLRALCSRGESVETIRAEIATDANRNACAVFCEHLQHRFAASPNPAAATTSPGKIFAQPPGLPTTTVNSESGLLIGLHLDNWSRLSFDRRQEAQNRICANIGSEDRFLLFVNLPIHAICQALASSHPAVHTLGGTELARKFLALHPLYPVVRLRIKPGEAYIAPTENIVHDGSSLGAAKPDVTVMVRGNFAPR
jgi:hypothetical protein